MGQEQVQPYRDVLHVFDWLVSQLTLSAAKPNCCWFIAQTVAAKVVLFKPEKLRKTPSDSQRLTFRVHSSWVSWAIIPAPLRIFALLSERNCAERAIKKKDKMMPWHEAKPLNTWRRRTHCKTEERRELPTSGSALVTEKLHLPLAKSPKLPPSAEPLPNAAAAAKDNGLSSASGHRPLAGPTDPWQLASFALRRRQSLLQGHRHGRTEDGELRARCGSQGSKHLQMVLKLLGEFLPA